MCISVVSNRIDTVCEVLSRLPQRWTGSGQEVTLYRSKVNRPLYANEGSSTMSISVVGVGDTSESFLARCIPNLQAQTVTLTGREVSVCYSTTSTPQRPQWQPVSSAVPSGVSTQHISPKISTTITYQRNSLPPKTRSKILTKYYQYATTVIFMARYIMLLCIQ